MEEKNRLADFQKLREMIKEIDFCMLTTVDENDDLHSRPMSLNSDVGLKVGQSMVFHFCELT